MFDLALIEPNGVENGVREMEQADGESAGVLKFPIVADQGWAAASDHLFWIDFVMNQREE